MTHTEPIRAEAEDWIGREIGGKYRVVKLVGRGGMGAVYEAENIALGKRVALKFIDVESAKNADGIQRFIREARAASTIESAHIVQVFDVGELDDGRPYIVMELLRGENLGARLHRLGRLSVAEALHVGVQVLHGLHRAHDAGIVHRDLKPENVFLVETDDDPMFAKIVDFGISKITRQSKTLEPGTLTQEGVVLGTPFYMAPEQAQALPDLDGRADLWSLGAILYECLAGRRPFTGDTYEQVIIAICTKSAEDLHRLAPDVPPPVVDAIMQALTRDREDRFASAKAFLGALHASAPELVRTGPPSYDLTTDRRAVSGKSEHPSGPRTGVSWSSAGERPVDVATAAPDPSQKKHVKLAVVGGTTALLAFALTVGIISRLRPPTEASSATPTNIVPSNGAPSSAPSAATVRIESNVPHAIVVVDGTATPDGLLLGLPGETHEVSVVAPGFAPEQRTVTIRRDVSVVRFELAPVASNLPSPSAAPVASKRAGAVPHGSKSPGSTPSPESGSLTGGLELKTDIP
jgi:eukaryotic-like serine/threonine-protein kinase